MKTAIIDVDNREDLLIECNNLITNLSKQNNLNKLDIVDNIVNLYHSYFCTPNSNMSPKESAIVKRRTIISTLIDAENNNVYVPTYGNIFIKDLVRLLTTDNYIFNPLLYNNVNLLATPTEKIRLNLNYKYTLPTTLETELFIMFNKLSELEIVYILKILIILLSDDKSKV